jgi:hypothetical protein
MTFSRLRLRRLDGTSFSLLAAASLCIAPASGPAADLDARGGQFIAFKSFSAFGRARGEKASDVVLTSPVIVARISADELIASWNAVVPGGTWLKVEARALYPGATTKYFCLGEWSSDPARHPRRSVLDQKDLDGDVATDTLILKRPATRFQVRITLGASLPDKPRLEYLGLSLTGTRADLAPLPPNTRAWGKLIEVPEKSQMAYTNGGVLCSPTTVSMMMAYWAKELRRPDLNVDVPQIVDAIYDSNWKGTGNWVFNTAYAGSFRGMRAYVTRMTDLSELEDWIAAGIPVGLSLCYDLLRGRPCRKNGHLVVCAGFTEDGDPILNDPGTAQNVRKVFPRKNLIRSWAYSKNAAYIIIPADSEIPRDRFGHWDSWTARQRVVFE